MGTLLKINGRVFEINNRENEIMKGWRKKRRMRPKPEPEPEQHEYVDLGLPSKTLWATENIKDVNGNELYFAWGETQGYTSGQVGTDKIFSEEDYEFNPSHMTGYTPSKYNSTDGKKVLDVEDDAATANWGSNWRIPTKEQFDELIVNTTTAFTEQNGIIGLLCTSTANTGNTLFLPAVGFVRNGKVDTVGDVGNYWSASLDGKDNYNALELSFRGGYCRVYEDTRCYGYSVRPVRSND